MKVARTIVATLALLLVSLAQQGEVRADDDPQPGVQPPAGGELVRYPPSYVRLPLIAGGIGLTGVVYAATALIGANWSEVPGADALKVPLVGPWIALAQTGCAPDDPDCEAILYLRGVLYVLSGLVQAAGLGIAAEGIFMTTEAAEPPRKKQTSITIAPYATEHSAGLGLTGMF